MEAIGYFKIEMEIKIASDADLFFVWVIENFYFFY